MSGTTSANEALVLGAAPRVHLLPPEVEAKQRARAQRRLLLVVLVGVLVLVVVGIGGATVAVFASNASLAAEQSHTASLLAEQRKFGSVTTVQSQVSDIKTAQAIGAAGEITWMNYVSSIKGTLSPGMSMTSVQTTLASGSPAAAAPGSLQAPFAATILITASSPKAQISDWLDALGTLKGFVDANPGSVQLDTTSGQYTVQVVMHINSETYAKRFVAGKK